MCERRHELGDLRVGAEREDRQRARARVHRDRDADAGVGARELLEHEDVRHEVGARAAVLLRHADAQQAEIPELGEQLAREPVRAIPVGGVRLDLGGGELARNRLDLALLRRELEVHARQTTPMKRFAILALVVVLAACGGHSARSAEDTARAWSAALNASDNEAAANLFAPNTEIIQNGEIVLRTHRDAVRWNAGLPCGGRITRVIQQRKDQVLVVFRLTGRPGHRCDAPGIEAAAVFRVEHGKIVLWRQTVPPDEAPAPTGEGPSI